MLKKVSDEADVGYTVIGQLCIEYAQPPRIPTPTPPSIPRPPTPGVPSPSPPDAPVISEYFYTDGFGQCWREGYYFTNAGVRVSVGKELVRC